MGKYITQITQLGEGNCCYDRLGKRFEIATAFKNSQYSKLPFLAIVGDTQIQTLEGDAIVIHRVLGILADGGVLELSKEVEYELAMATKI
jgi:hypothetical protein